MKTTYLHFIKQRRKLYLFVFGALLLIFSGLFLNSCIKKEDFEFNKLAGFEYSPNIAAPLVNTKLTLSKLLNAYNKNNYITVDPHTGLLTLIYSQTVYSERADQIIIIPSPQTINTVLNFNTPALATNFDSSSYSNTSNYTFNSPSGARYDSVFLKSGYIQYYITITPSFNNSRVYISIPQATKNGVPFKKIVTSPYPAFPASDTFNLNGYVLRFPGGGNQIAITYKVITWGPAAANNYSVSMGESIISPLYSKIFGYFGQIPVTVNEDSVSISVFKNKINGVMKFMNPTIMVKSINSIGVPLAVTLDTLKAYTVTPPNSVVLTVGPKPFPTWPVWTVPDPTWPNVSSIADSFYLDTLNSNIRTLINISPNYVALKAGALTNPTGLPSTPNFVLDSSRFSLNMQVELPLFGNGYMTMVDTVKFSFGSVSVSQLQWALFAINTVNGFPLGAVQQIYFADTNYHKIDSLLTTSQQQTIVAASVGGPPTYYVTSPSTKPLQIKVTQAFLQHVSNVRYLIISSRLTTTNNGSTPVMIYNTDYMNVKLGVQVQAQTVVYPNHKNK